MHIICPHCQNAIELVQVPEEVLCPSCGSSFRVAQGATEPLAGRQKLGRFELLGTVGFGAFGTVYKARDPDLDRVVAVKVPRPGNAGNGEPFERFSREARSVAQLRHPSIVSVHEVGQLEGLPYLVSDFIHGITLADLLTDRSLPPREAARLIAAVATALQYAHEQGVVHRDVKPSNIMLDADLQPHVTDFGLAKREAGEITMTLEGQVLGTPAYMSPEQARGEAHRVDGRSDVYSLGAVLYQLLTNELPFRGNARMLLHHVLHDEPRPPRKRNPAIPRDLETICLKAMAKEPRRRYQSARELAEDLTRFLNGEPIRARRSSPVYRLVRWGRREPKLAALSGVVVVLVSALAGTLAMSAYRSSVLSSSPGPDLSPPGADSRERAQGPAQPDGEQDARGSQPPRPADRMPIAFIPAKGAKTTKRPRFVEVRADGFVVHPEKGRHPPLRVEKVNGKQTYLVAPSFVNFLKAAERDRAAEYLMWLIHSDAIPAYRNLMGYLFNAKLDLEFGWEPFHPTWELVTEGKAAFEVEFRPPHEPRVTTARVNVGLVCQESRVTLLDLEEMFKILSALPEAEKQVLSQKGTLHKRVSAGDYTLDCSFSRSQGLPAFQARAQRRAAEPGETLAEFAKPGSRIRQRLAQLEPGKNIIQVAVYPDSYSLYLAVRREVWSLGFDIHWLPVAPGEPIQIGSGIPSGQ